MSLDRCTDLDFAAMLGELPSRCGHRRIDRGLSLREAAAEIGVPVATLHRFEQRKGDARWSVACKVARWLTTVDAIQPPMSSEEQ